MTNRCQYDLEAYLDHTITFNYYGSVFIVPPLHGPSTLPDNAKSVVCSTISLARSYWMKHLVIGQLQKPAKFSAFHWSTSRSQAFIGQLLGTSRVLHLPKRTVMVLFTISDA